MEDYYDTLGVDHNASNEEIKQAYHKLAHKYHPDKKDGDEENFKKINNAYQVLSNKQKRAQYDQYGQSFSGFGQDYSSPFGQGFRVNMEDFEGLGSIFNHIFNRSSAAQKPTVRQGDNIEIDITISFLESAQGLKYNIKLRLYQACPHCHGNGAEPGTPISTCQACQGRGVVNTTRQTVLGIFTQPTTCPDCSGEGKQAATKCSQCHGEGRTKQAHPMSVNIPSGIADGQAIRLAGKGEFPPRGGLPGDLYVKVHVKEHPTMQRDKMNIKSRVSIPFTDAALGSKVTIDTVDGKKQIDIPPGTQPNTEIVLNQLGFPSLNSSNRGDHIVTINVNIPKKLSRQQKKLLQQFNQFGKHFFSV